MKELEYPFDAEYLIQKNKLLKKKLLSDHAGYIEKKVAILGGSTTDLIRKMIELFLLNQGIQPLFYESEYNQFYQDAVFDYEKLIHFGPDIIYIHTTNRNIVNYPQMKDSPERIQDLLQQELKRFEEVWESLRKNITCPIIQNNMEMPYYRLMGNREASDIHGKVNFLSRMNMGFYDYAQRHDNFYICDINYISADYGLANWSDPSSYYLYKYALSVNAIPYLAFNVSNIMKSVFGRNKKGIVLDLDNTLWGGVIGDDGVDHIALGMEDGEGMAYLEFQKYIKEQKDIGIVLSINSKNERENALIGLHHPDSVLAENDFASIQTNWQTKDQNLSKIASELSLLPESLVFVDDNAAERELIHQQFPEVLAPEIKTVQEYIHILDRSGFFEVTFFSEEDLERAEMYQNNGKRARLKEGFSDYGEYLKSLQMEAVIHSFDSVYVGRIAQLTNKTNQFNLTTHRFTQQEIEEIGSDPNYIAFYGKLSDRFGDNGVVSVIIGQIKEQICDINLWIMSCRVLKRDMELLMMDHLVMECKNRGILTLMGHYYPTDKNSMVKNLYETLGFQKVFEDVQGNADWSFQIPKNYTNQNKVIKENGRKS